jgi:beta-glucosidase
MTTAQFPAGFRWGVATAAFQIEGATDADGRTDSIWDELCRRPGAVLNGDTGEVACDHYRRMPQDVAMMRDLGVGTYRFSTSWCRVRPDGGAVNQAGVDFYSRLVDELLGQGIAPWLTLYHWDLPQALEDRGGWTSRDTAERFVEYALTMHEALGDRVPTWTTLNEPWCSSLLSYGRGEHAPGRTEPRAAVAAVHHLLLAHGMAASALRGAGVGSGRGDELGITLNVGGFTPADPGSEGDLDVVRRLDGLQNRVFLDPVLRGEYPADVVADLEPFGFSDHVRDGDLDLIGTPIDVLGLNYYSSSRVRDGAGTWPSPWIGADTPERARVEVVRRDLPRTAMGWEVTPEVLRDLLVRFDREYDRIGNGTSVVITENGAAYDDPEPVDGRVADEDRRAYLESHLRACHEAIEAGVPLTGYLAWSLMDNFEWAFGYDRRFGIVHVDYGTQVRTPKDSALWYSKVMRDNGF